MGSFSLFELRTKAENRTEKNQKLMNHHDYYFTSKNKLRKHLKNKNK